jgi:hypothetical protein
MNYLWCSLDVACGKRTSENAVKAKFVRNVYYDVGLIRASRKAEADF